MVFEVFFSEINHVIYVVCLQIYIYNYFWENRTKENKKYKPIPYTTGKCDLVLQYSGYLDGNFAQKIYTKFRAWVYHSALVLHCS